MTRAFAALCAASIMLIAWPGTAGAQNASSPERVRVSLNVGSQPSSTTFTGSTSAPVYLETSTITTTYGVPSGQIFDGGAAVRIAGGFGLGVAVSSFNKAQDATVAGSIPHPFFYNTPRSIAGTASGLRRSEVVVHLQVVYVISSSRISLALSAGPSFFNVSQDLVSGVSYTEVYPYDTATFTAATTTKAKATGTGYNAGADIGIKVIPHLGIGGLVRVSRVSVSFPLAGSSAGVGVDAGGVQVAGGLRFFF